MKKYWMWRFLWMFFIKPIYFFYSVVGNTQPHTHSDKFRWQGYTVLHSHSVHNSLNTWSHIYYFDKLLHKTIIVWKNKTLKIKKKHQIDVFANSTTLSTVLKKQTTNRFIFNTNTILLMINCWSSNRLIWIFYCHLA